MQTGLPAMSKELRSGDRSDGSPGGSESLGVLPAVWETPEDEALAGGSQRGDGEESLSKSKSAPSLTTDDGARKNNAAASSDKATSYPVKSWSGSHQQGKAASQAQAGRRAPAAVLQKAAVPM